MTRKNWLAQAANQLRDIGLSRPESDATLILGHTLQLDKASLLAHADQLLGPEEQTQADSLLTRRAQHEPLAFVLGHKEFFGLELKTDTRALIPRWETEILVETALEWLKSRRESKIVAEVGTGSGAIITALAQSAPHHRFYATEISSAALDLAKENAAKHDLTDITFLDGDLGVPLIQAGLTGRVNLLVANLPYIPSGLLQTLDATVQYYEPNVALEGGETGLELYEQFMPQAQALLAPGGLMLLEHDRDQGEAMRTLARKTFPTAEIATLQDYLGDDRLLSCQN